MFKKYIKKNPVNAKSLKKNTKEIKIDYKLS